MTNTVHMPVQWPQWPLRDYLCISCFIQGDGLVSKQRETFAHKLEESVSLIHILQKFYLP